MPFQKSRPPVGVITATLCGALTLISPQTLFAQAAIQQSAQSPLDARHTYNINAGSLASALRNLAGSTNVLLTFKDEQTRNKTTSGINGSYMLEEAFAALLAGTGLQAVKLDNGSYVLRESPVASVGILKTVKVTAESMPGELPETYAGGQVARGGQLGLLGNQDLFETPYSVASYTAELIENQQSRTLADVVSNDSSVHLVTAFGGGAETLVIRGFNAGGNSGSLYAGLPGMAHRRVTHVETLERVEVLKGSHALLSGMIGAVGGVTNLVPKKPTELPLTRLTTSFEGASKLGMHADISRRFGADNKIGTRINGIFRDGENSLENSEQDYQQFTVAADYLTETFRSEIYIDYADETLSSPSQLFIPAMNMELPSPPEMKKAIQQPWEKNNHTFSRVLLKSEYDVAEDWTLHGSVGKSDFEGNWLRTIGSNLQNDGQFNQIASQQIDDAENQAARVGIRGAFKTNAISHKLSMEYLSTEVDSGRFSQNVQGYTVISNIHNPVFVDRPVLTAMPDNVPKESDGKDSSFAIADTLGFINDQLLLTLGVRNQTIDSKSFNRNTGAKISDYKKSAATPSVGVLYKLYPTFSIYGNYIEALEHGPIAPETAENSGEAFAPSKTDQMELGGKWDLENIGLSVALFQIAQPSGITGANNYFVVDGEQRHQGIEFSAFGQLNPDVRVIAGFTYIDAQLTKTQNGTLDGKRPIGVPDINAVLNIEWDVQQLEGLTLTGGVNHTGSRIAREDNSAALSSYQVFDIGARYKQNVGGKPLTVRMGLDNAFNENYWTIFSGSRVIYIGKPRTFNLSVSMDI